MGMHPTRCSVRRAVTAMLGAVATVALAAGCAGEPATGPAPAPAPSSTATPDEESTTADTADTADGPPAFGRGTGRRTSDPSRNALLVLTDVRTGEARRFDRVVLEFSGRGTPGYVVNYVDRAVRDGSGQVVDLGRGSVLDVYASGTTAPAPDYYDGPRRLSPLDGDVLDGLFVAGTFEGFTQVLAGIDGDRAPFRVFTLTSPPRLVVDVAATE